MNKKKFVILSERVRVRYKGFHPKIWFSGNDKGWILYIFNKETKHVILKSPPGKTQDEIMQTVLDFFDHQTNLKKG